MEMRDILRHVDHTLLKPEASWDEVSQLCEEAMAWGCASVCIPPCYVRQARDAFPTLTIGTVVGFPLGYDSTAAKVAEARAALADGADELDMVINIGAARAHNYALVTDDIRQVREASHGQVLKVIIEACYLDHEEKVALCAIISDLGVDYIKTSTGFGPAGATVEDIRLFREHLDPEVAIKAAGGIRTREAMEAMLRAGATRIGASAAVRLAEEMAERAVPAATGEA